MSFDDLAALQDVLAEEAFSRRLVWEEENRWVNVRGAESPTAFVEADDRGRELDIHVIQVRPGQAPTPLCDVPWTFDHQSLDGTGTIAGVAVRCVPAQTQVQMHSGYDLPPHHQRDLERVLGLVIGRPGAGA